MVRERPVVSDTLEGKAAARARTRAPPNQHKVPMLVSRDCSSSATRATSPTTASTKTPRRSSSWPRRASARSSTSCAGPRSSPSAGPVSDDVQLGFTRDRHRRGRKRRDLGNRQPRRGECRAGTHFHRVPGRCSAPRQTCRNHCDGACSRWGDALHHSTHRVIVPKSLCVLDFFLAERSAEKP
jgi:hypothetical protein